MQSAQVPLFMVGGLNHPTQHSSMIGLVSAGSGVSTHRSHHFITVDDDSTVSQVSSDFIFRPDDPSSSDPAVFGTYWGNSVSATGDGDRLPLLPIIPTSQVNLLSAYDIQADHSFTWFDPGYRGGGGDASYNVYYPDSGYSIAYKYTGHAGIYDGPDYKKQDKTTAWISGPGRHKAEFFVHGRSKEQLDAGAGTSVYSLGTPAPYQTPNNQGYGSPGAFFYSKWGTPVSYFNIGATGNFLSTRVLDPLYRTERKILSGSEPWVSRSGEIPDLHCTMWIRPVTAQSIDNTFEEMVPTLASEIDVEPWSFSVSGLSAEYRAYTTPCFASGRGGVNGLSLMIEDDNKPSWHTLRTGYSGLGLQINRTNPGSRRTELVSISSFDRPTNIWISHEGVKAMADGMAGYTDGTLSGYGVDGRYTSTGGYYNSIFSRLNYGYYHSDVNREALLASTSDVINRIHYKNSNQNFESEKFSYLYETLKGAPELLFHFQDPVNDYSNFNISPIGQLASYSQYLSTQSTGADDTLLWGVSSGGSHLTLRYHDRIISEAPQKIKGKEWINVGFYARPVDGAQLSYAKGNYSQHTTTTTSQYTTAAPLDTDYANDLSQLTARFQSTQQYLDGQITGGGSQAAYYMSNFLYFHNFGDADIYNNVAVGDYLYWEGWEEGIGCMYDSGCYAFAKVKSIQEINISPPYNVYYIVAPPTGQKLKKVVLEKIRVSTGKEQDTVWQEGSRMKQEHHVYLRKAAAVTSKKSLANLLVFTRGNMSPVAVNRSTGTVEWIGRKPANSTSTSSNYSDTGITPSYENRGMENTIPLGPKPITHKSKIYTMVIGTHGIDKKGVGIFCTDTVTGVKLWEYYYHSTSMSTVYAGMAVVAGNGLRADEPHYVNDQIIITSGTSLIGIDVDTGKEVSGWDGGSGSWNYDNNRVPFFSSSEGWDELWASDMKYGDEFGLNTRVIDRIMSAPVVSVHWVNGEKIQNVYCLCRWRYPFGPLRTGMLLLTPKRSYTYNRRWIGSLEHSNIEDDLQRDYVYNDSISDFSGYGTAESNNIGVFGHTPKILNPEAAKEDIDSLILYFPVRGTIHHNYKNGGILRWKKNIGFGRIARHTNQWGYVSDPDGNAIYVTVDKGLASGSSRMRLRKIFVSSDVVEGQIDYEPGTSTIEKWLSSLDNYNVAWEAPLHDIYDRRKYKRQPETWYHPPLINSEPTFSTPGVGEMGIGTDQSVVMIRSGAEGLGKCFAFDSQTGAELWNTGQYIKGMGSIIYPNGHPALSTSRVHNLQCSYALIDDKNKLFINAVFRGAPSDGPSLIAHNLYTGKVIWASHPLGKDPLMINWSPVLSDEVEVAESFTPPVPVEEGKCIRVSGAPILSPGVDPNGIYKFNGTDSGGKSEYVHTEIDQVNYERTGGRRPRYYIWHDSIWASGSYQPAGSKVGPNQWWISIFVGREPTDQFVVKHVTDRAPEDGFASQITDSDKPWEVSWVSEDNRRMADGGTLDMKLEQVVCTDTSEKIYRTPDYFRTEQVTESIANPNTQVGLFINGSLQTVKNCFVNGLQFGTAAPLNSPYSVVDSGTDDSTWQALGGDDQYLAHSSGSGEVTIGKSAACKNTSRHVATLADAYAFDGRGSNPSSGTVPPTEESWLPTRDNKWNKTVFLLQYNTAVEKEDDGDFPYKGSIKGVKYPIGIIGGLPSVSLYGYGDDALKSPVRAFVESSTARRMVYTNLPDKSSDKHFTGLDLSFGSLQAFNFNPETLKLPRTYGSPELEFWNLPNGTVAQLGYSRAGLSGSLPQGKVATYIDGNPFRSPYLNKRPNSYYMTVEDSASADDFKFGSDEWTIEMWVLPKVGENQLRAATDEEIDIDSDNALLPFISNAYGSAGLENGIQPILVGSHFNTLISKTGAPEVNPSRSDYGAPFAGADMDIIEATTGTGGIYKTGSYQLTGGGEGAYELLFPGSSTKRTANYRGGMKGWMLTYGSPLLAKNNLRVPGPSVTDTRAWQSIMFDCRVSKIFTGADHIEVSHGCVENHQMFDEERFNVGLTSPEDILNEGEWNHVAVQRVNSGRDLQGELTEEGSPVCSCIEVYVNGERVANETIPLDSIMCNASGAPIDIGDTPLNHRIDEKLFDVYGPRGGNVNPTSHPKAKLKTNTYGPYYKWDYQYMYGDVGPRAFQGHMDQIRITKGAARYKLGGQNKLDTASFYADTLLYESELNMTIPTIVVEPPSNAIIPNETTEEDQYIRFWPSQFLRIASLGLGGYQSQYQDRGDVYYIEHPTEKYGEYFSLSNTSQDGSTIGSAGSEVNGKYQFSAGGVNRGGEYTGLGLTYPAGSKVYYVNPVDLRIQDNCLWQCQHNTRIGEVYYAHNNHASSYFDTSNINDWQTLYRNFYLFTHGVGTRGQWAHDSNLYMDDDAAGWKNTEAYTFSPESSANITAGWGYYRYGGHDHKQFDENWEKVHLNPAGGDLPPLTALGGKIGGWETGFGDE